MESSINITALFNVQNIGYFILPTWQPESWAALHVLELIHLTWAEVHERGCGNSPQCEFGVNATGRAQGTSGVIVSRYREQVRHGGARAQAVSGDLALKLLLRSFTSTVFPGRNDWENFRTAPRSLIFLQLLWDWWLIVKSLTLYTHFY